MTEKIIICDDSQEILDLIKIVLEEEKDFYVETEIDSTKLISRIKTEKPDLLLLDLWMPKMSGKELLHLIRNDEKLSLLKIIVISASMDGEDVSTRLKADDFISKPFDINELIKKIRTLLER